ncbi:leukocyte immunoglobulin-like receptor subfamily B member 5 [Mauremys reevesii]|uniref:leukocyte immunoglobulin-like receptor subfamily B member 5 n=1 Tax=Mauremys reevesii TaxID=260615 RepID=UPI00193F6CF4|nr:leukocyte immunoglobulin-like receptor subfamily B member 5 [Mauremys reevesii]
MFTGPDSGSGSVTDSQIVPTLGPRVPSDPVQLVVAGREFLKPTLWVSPSRVVALGGNLTIRCEGRQRSMKFFLRKAGHPNPQVQTVPDGPVAEFPIPSVSRKDGGSYTCEYRSITEPSRWSYLSDPVKIIVGEPRYPKPSISLLIPSGGVSLGGAVTVQCWGQRWDVRFVLNKEGRHFPPVESDGLEAEFPISNVRREHGGSYSCSYHSRSEPFAMSYPSDPIELVVRDPSLPRPSISLSPTGVIALGADVTIRWGTDPTQPGAAPAPTHPGPGGSEPQGLTSPIIAGTSTAAAGLLLLLLLLVAFVCFRKTRARKGAAPRPSSTNPMVALKAPAQQEPLYASIDEGKELQTPPQEPDPDADGLTYADLDSRALQGKWGGLAPAPEPAQPSLYATINVSRGAPRDEQRKSPLSSTIMAPA